LLVSFSTQVWRGREEEVSFCTKISLCSFKFLDLVFEIWKFAEQF
jgi:hypothetical protein